MAGEVKVDWPVLLDWSEALRAIIEGGHLDVFEGYAETASVIATHSLVLYQGYLNGMPLPNGASIQRPSGNLARHAELRDGAGFCDWSLANDEAYAEAVEKGTRERDLKDMLATAKKARMSKDGSLYLVIPFRHGTPGAVGMRPMPARVHQMAKQLQRSFVVGTRMEKSGTGFMVQRNVYNKGYSKNALTAAQLNKAGLSFRDQNRYAGLYKFGNEGHSSYITFRVLSQKSKGWILPARPGLWPAKTAAEQALSDSAGLLSEALLSDLLRLAGI